MTPTTADFDEAFEEILDALKWFGEEKPCTCRYEYYEVTSSLDVKRQYVLGPRTHTEQDCPKHGHT